MSCVLPDVARSTKHSSRGPIAASSACSFKLARGGCHGGSSCRLLSRAVWAGWVCGLMSFGGFYIATM